MTVPSLAAAAVSLAVLASAPGAALAHCDTVDGPVAQASRRALETRNADHALVWVEEAREGEVRDALRRALAVRGLSDDAKQLADHWFLETVVRLHRAGEGKPYVGLKPAGSPVEPVLLAADQAVATGSLAPLARFLPREGAAEAQAALDRVLALQARRADDVRAGRAFVRAYVDFLHRFEHGESTPAAGAAGGTLAPPPALSAEHVELHERLAEAIASGGATADAARALAKVLHPHFVREEEIATPPLSLLPAIVRGGVTPDMRPALEKTRALRAEMPRMLQEHVAIKAAMRALGDAADREGKAKIANAARRLVRHAETEEQVVYPAALLVGVVLEAAFAK
jgi:hypothetical protein